MKQIIFNIELEQSLLGTLLQFDNYFYEVSDDLLVDDFYDNDSKIIFKEMLQENFDIMLINEKIRCDIFDILAKANISINLSETVEELKKLKKVRRIKDTKDKVDMMLNNENYSEAIEAFENTELDDNTVKGYQNGLSVFEDFINHREEEAKTNVDGALWEYLGWLVPWQLIVVGARPSVWKSAFAVNLAVNNIYKWENIWFFWLEMTNRENLARFLKCITWTKDIRDESIRQEYENELKSLYMYDLSGELSDLKRQIKKMVRKDDVSIVYLDYLQILFKSGSERLWKNYEVSQITRELKSLAQELGIVIFLLSQLNRNSVNRPNKKPVLSDLRDSWSIEQDANKVILLHRESLYDNDDDWWLDVILAKNREGKIAEINMEYDLDIMRIDLNNWQVGEDLSF